MQQLNRLKGTGNTLALKTMTLNALIAQLPDLPTEQTDISDVQKIRNLLEALMVIIPEVAQYLQEVVEQCSAMSGAYEKALRKLRGDDYD